MTASSAGSPPPARSGPPSGPNRKGWRRIATVVVLTLAGIYTIRLAGLAWTVHQSAVTADRLATDVAALHAEVDAVETARADAAGPGAVERWARDHRWARPGDRVIAAVAVPTPTPTPAPPTSTPASMWDAVEAWLRDG